MGLTLSQRRAVTKAIATRYKRSDKAGKGVILDELCAMTGWHRNHARRALAQALRPKGLQVVVDAVGIDEREFAQGGFPALGDGFFDEAPGGFAGLALGGAGLFGAFPGALVLDVGPRGTPVQHQPPSEASSLTARACQKAARPHATRPPLSEGFDGGRFTKVRIGVKIDDRFHNQSNRKGRLGQGAAAQVR